MIPDHLRCHAINTTDTPRRCRRAAETIGPYCGTHARMDAAGLLHQPPARICPDHPHARIVSHPHEAPRCAQCHRITEPREIPQTFEPGRPNDYARTTLADIANLLHAQEWTAETLDQIADLVRAAGFIVASPEDVTP